MTPQDARTFWKSLMDNASALIADAGVLLRAESFGRARALAVLAQEELGKALWIYDTFESPWSDGSTEPRKVDRLAKHGTSHIQKFLEASVFGDELAHFWGQYGEMETPREGESYEEFWKRREEEAEVAARAANIAKQQGFYVDRDKAGVITSPTAVEAGTIAEDLRVAAQVVEMLLIRDHTRMKKFSTTEYDDTYEQQFRLLPIAHPEDWAAASEEFRRGAEAGVVPETEG